MIRYPTILYGSAANRRLNSTSLIVEASRILLSLFLARVDQSDLAIPSVVSWNRYGPDWP